MNIRRILRLSCLTVASLFWASCGDDTNSQAPAPEPEIPDPESSTDAAGTNSSSSEDAVSSAKEETFSSSETVSSSSSVESKRSSSSEASSSSYDGYVLASDPSVTCEDFYEDSGRICTTYYTCEDYQKYLGSDTTIAESLLMQWEDKLEDCGAVTGPVALYGVMYRAHESCAEYAHFGGFKCSNDSTYGPKDFVFGEDKVLYRTIEEYDAAHGISSSYGPESSSSAEESSSSSENMVQNCRHVDFSRFVDVLAEVQKGLFVDITTMLDDGPILNDAQKEYLEGLLDRGQWTLKDNFAPYLVGHHEEDYTVVDESEYWFDGYIARREECPGGVPEMTKRYHDKYYEILNECRVVINEKIKSLQ